MYSRIIFHYSDIWPSCLSPARYEIRCTMIHRVWQQPGVGWSTTLLLRIIGKTKQSISSGCILLELTLYLLWSQILHLIPSFRWIGKICSQWGMTSANTLWHRRQCHQHGGNDSTAIWHFGGAWYPAKPSNDRLKALIKPPRSISTPQNISYAAHKSEAVVAAVDRSSVKCVLNRLHFN